MRAGEVTLRLGADFTDEDEFRRYDRAIERARAQKNVETALKGDYDARAFRAYERAQDKAKATARRREAFKTALGGDFDARAFRQYEKALDRAQRDGRRGARARLAAAFDPRPWRQHDSAIRAAQRRTGILERSTGALGRSMKTAAGYIGLYGVAGALGLAGKATIDFDRGMRNVNSIAQVSEGQLRGISKAVLAMAKDTAQAPQSLSTGLYDLVSSGFKAKDALKVLGAAAKGATAGLTTTDVAVDAVSSVLLAYRLPASDAAKVTDTLFRTVDKGKVTFEQLASTIGDTLPFASSLSVDLNQLGASIATMTKAGLSPAETMTRLRAVMVSMLKPSGDLKDSITELGYANGEQMIKTLGFQGTLDALAKSVHGDKSAMAELFPNIRALGGALALTGKNSRAAGEDLKAFGDTSGATNRALSQQSQSISYAWNRIKATISALAITFGSKAAPAVAKFLTQMVDGKGAGGEFIATMKSIGETVGDAASAIFRIVGPIAKFVATAPGIKQLAGQLLAVGLALKAIRVVGALTGLNKLATGAYHLAGRMGKAGEASGAALATGVTKGAGKGNDAVRRQGSAWGRMMGGGVVAETGKAAGRVPGAFRSKLQGSAFYGMGKGLIGMQLAFGAIAGLTSERRTLKAKFQDAISTATFGLTPKWYDEVGPQSRRALQGFVKEIDSITEHTGKSRKELWEWGAVMRENARTADAADDPKFADMLREVARHADTARRKIEKLSLDDLRKDIADPKFNTEKGIFGSIEKRLRHLPINMKQAGLKSSIELARGLEAEGRIPRGATEDLVKDIMAKFPKLRPYLRSIGFDSMEAMAAAFRDRKVVKSVQGQLDGIHKTWGQFPKLANTTASNVEGRWRRAMAFLKGVMEHGPKDQRAAAKRAYDQLAGDAKRASEATRNAWRRGIIPAGTLTDTSRAVGRLGRVLGDLFRPTKKAADGSEDAARQIRRLANRSDDARTSLRRLAKGGDDAARELRRLRRDSNDDKLRRLATEALGLRARLKGLDRGSAEYRETARKLRKTQDELNRELGEAQKKGRTASDALKALKDTAFDLGKAMSDAADGGVTGLVEKVLDIPDKSPELDKLAEGAKKAGGQAWGAMQDVFGLGRAIDGLKSKTIYVRVHQQMTTRRARGGKVTSPVLVQGGEEAPQYPEFWISTNPRDKARMGPLLIEAIQAVMGKGAIARFQAGGTLPATGGRAPLSTYKGGAARAGQGPTERSSTRFRMRSDGRFASSTSTVYVEGHLLDTRPLLRGVERVAGANDMKPTARAIKKMTDDVRPLVRGIGKIAASIERMVQMAKAGGGGGGGGGNPWETSSSPGWVDKSKFSKEDRREFEHKPSNDPNRGRRGYTQAEDGTWVPDSYYGKRSVSKATALPGADRGDMRATEKASKGLAESGEAAAKGLRRLRDDSKDDRIKGLADRVLTLRDRLKRLDKGSADYRETNRKLQQATDRLNRELQDTDRRGRKARDTLSALAKVTKDVVDEADEAGDRVGDLGTTIDDVPDKSSTLHNLADRAGFLTNRATDAAREVLGLDRRIEGLQSKSITITTFHKAIFSKEKRARGGKVTAPGTVWHGNTLIEHGEEAPQFPEYWISTNPRDRARMVPLIGEVASELGIALAQFARGGKSDGEALLKAAAFKQIPKSGTVRAVGDVAQDQPGKASQWFNSMNRRISRQMDRFDRKTRNADLTEETFLVPARIKDPNDPNKTIVDPSGREVLDPAAVAARRAELNDLIGFFRNWVIGPEIRNQRRGLSDYYVDEKGKPVKVTGPADFSDNYRGGIASTVRYAVAASEGVFGRLNSIREMVRRWENITKKNFPDRSEAFHDKALEITEMIDTGHEQRQDWWDQIKSLQLDVQYLERERFQLDGIRAPVITDPSGIPGGEAAVDIASRMFAEFQSARQDLFKSFGSNFIPTGMGWGGLNLAAGPQNYGAASAADAGGGLGAAGGRAQLTVNGPMFQLQGSVDNPHGYSNDAAWQVQNAFA